MMLFSFSRQKFSFIWKIRSKSLNKIRFLNKTKYITFEIRHLSNHFQIERCKWLLEFQAINQLKGAHPLKFCRKFLSHIREPIPYTDLIILESSISGVTSWSMDRDIPFLDFHFSQLLLRLNISIYYDSILKCNFTYWVFQIWTNH